MKVEQPAEGSAEGSAEGGVEDAAAKSEVECGAEDDDRNDVDEVVKEGSAEEEQ